MLPTTKLACLFVCVLFILEGQNVMSQCDGSGFPTEWTTATPGVTYWFITNILKRQFGPGYVMTDYYTSGTAIGPAPDCMDEYYDVATGYYYYLFYYPGDNLYSLLTGVQLCHAFKQFGSVIREYYEDLGTSVILKDASNCVARFTSSTSSLALTKYNFQYVDCPFSFDQYEFTFSYQGNLDYCAGKESSAYIDYQTIGLKSCYDPLLVNNSNPYYGAFSCLSYWPPEERDTTSFGDFIVIEMYDAIQWPYCGRYKVDANGVITLSIFLSISQSDWHPVLCIGSVDNEFAFDDGTNKFVRMVFTPPLMTTSTQQPTTTTNEIITTTEEPTTTTTELPTTTEQRTTTTTQQPTTTTTEISTTTEQPTTTTMEITTTTHQPTTTTEQPTTTTTEISTTTEQPTTTTMEITTTTHQPTTTTEQPTTTTTEISTTTEQPTTTTMEITTTTHQPTTTTEQPTTTTTEITTTTHQPTTTTTEISTTTEQPTTTTMEITTTTHQPTTTTEQPTTTTTEITTTTHQPTTTTEQPTTTTTEITTTTHKPTTTEISTTTEQPTTTTMKKTTTTHQPTTTTEQPTTTTAEKDTTTIGITTITEKPTTVRAVYSTAAAEQLTTGQQSAAHSETTFWDHLLDLYWPWWILIGFAAFVMTLLLCCGICSACKRRKRKVKGDEEKNISRMRNTSEQNLNKPTAKGHARAGNTSEQNLNRPTAKGHARAGNTSDRNLNKLRVKRISVKPFLQPKWCS